MAVKSYALTTRQRLKDFIGITANDDTTNNVLDRIIDSVTEFIENYIGYRVKQTTYTNEEYDTQLSDKLILQKFPIDSGSAFTLQRRNSSLNEDDWETIDSQYYHVDNNAGIIYGAGGWKFARTRRGYRVTYTAGFNFDNSATFLSDTEGAELEWACWKLCSAAWDRRKGGTGIQSESIGDYKVVYAKESMESQDIKDILDKYAKHEAGGYITPILY